MLARRPSERCGPACARRPQPRTGTWALAPRPAAASASLDVPYTRGPHEWASRAAVSPCRLDTSAQLPKTPKRVRELAFPQGQGLGPIKPVFSYGTVRSDLARGGATDPARLSTIGYSCIQQPAASLTCGASSWPNAGGVDGLPFATTGTLSNGIGL